MTRNLLKRFNQKQMAVFFATLVPNVNIHISNMLKENELEINSVIKDYLITATLKQGEGCFRINTLKKNELELDSVVKDFFITAEENSVVGKEGIQMEEVSVCKESLLTVSSVAKFATVQMEGIKVRQHRTY